MKQNILKTTDSQSEIAIFATPDGQVLVDVKVGIDTVWLSLEQLSSLFERDKSVISRHIKNIFKGEELSSKSVVANFATTAKDEKIYQVDHYNLDMIISIGYRVNSKRGIQFRQWANQILKEYLIKGYTLNRKKLALEGVKDIERSIELLSRTLIQENIINDIGQAALNVIIEYSKTWRLLLQYDEDKLPTVKHSSKQSKILGTAESIDAIKELKKKLGSIGEATELFGVDRGNHLDSILRNIEQTFAGHDLYQTIEAKAAHLLYFIIKDHPFIDGNKRIGSFLFILYLRLNDVEMSKINEVSLTAIALLVAESKPAEKELMIKLLTNFLS